MPWKNGKGTTREIAIFPKQTNFNRQRFLWRLSSAEVTQNGPFSSFPGYDRFLTLANGKSLRLRFTEGREDLVVSKGQVVRFSGGVPVHAELSAGAVTDLGLIFDKASVKASFEIVTLAAKPRSFQTTGRTAFVVALEGRATVTLFPGEEKFNLEPSDALEFEMRSSDSGMERIALFDPPSGQRKAVFAVIELTW